MESSARGESCARLTVLGSCTDDSILLEREFVSLSIINTGLVMSLILQTSLAHRSILKARVTLKSLD